MIANFSREKKLKKNARSKKSEETIMIPNQENSSSVSDLKRKFGNLVSQNELNKRKSSITIGKIDSKLTPSNQNYSKEVLRDDVMIVMSILLKEKMKPK